MREPRYGEIDTRNNPGAYEIYRNRHKELPLLIKEVEVVDEIDYIDQYSIDDSARMVWEFLDELDPLDKRILIMLYESEMTYLEISEELSIKRNKIESVINNALGELKTLVCIKIKYHGLKLDFMSNFNYGKIYDTFFYKNMVPKNFRSLISKIDNIK